MTEIAGDTCCLPAAGPARFFGENCFQLLGAAFFELVDVLAYTPQRLCAYFFRWPSRQLVQQVLWKQAALRKFDFVIAPCRSYTQARVPRRILRLGCLFFVVRTLVLGVPRGVSLLCLHRTLSRVFVYILR